LCPLCLLCEQPQIRDIALGHNFSHIVAVPLPNLAHGQSRDWASPK
jgi:hypothetical protein